jgi:hypothetical protein
MWLTNTGQFAPKMNGQYHRIFHPIPKPFTKNGKKDVLEIVPTIEVVNHLGIGFCQALWGGHINFIDLCP